MEKKSCCQSRLGRVGKRKRCAKEGCEKYDAGGGYCVAHGGGRPCRVAGCTKIAQRGGACRGHGGSGRCSMDGCTKVDAGGGKCRRHGGGRRCQFKGGCVKSDVGGGFCTMHGGGKRCTVQNCNKSDQGGGFCKAHGGGSRCRIEGCKRSAQGRSGLCATHGRKEQCAHRSCVRAPRGNSQFCKEHGQRMSESQVAATKSDSASLDTNLGGDLKEFEADDYESEVIGWAVVNNETDFDFDKPWCCCTMAGGMIASGCCRAFGGVCNCPEGCPCKANNITKSEEQTILH